MVTLRTSSRPLGVLAIVWLLAGSVMAQPPTAAWVGTLRSNPDFAAPENWINPQTGQTLTVPPGPATSIFFRFEAGQAPRDPEGNVVVALRQDDLAAERMEVEALPFRFVDGGTLRIGQQADAGQGVLTVENGGVLTLDTATLQVRDSAFVGGGPMGPFEQGILSIAPGGRLNVGETLQIWDSAGSVVQLAGGELRASKVDASTDPQRFQWLGGQLSFDEFLGDLTNRSGLLTPGDPIGAAHIQGSYSQFSGGTLAIQLGGTDLGMTHDHLSIAGNLTADGILAVSLAGGFTPTVGEEFDILDFATLEGQFANVTLPDLPASLGWDIDRLYTDGVLRVFDAVIPTMWTGAAGDGDYFNPENWQPQLVPVNQEDQAFALTIPQGAGVTLPSTQEVSVSRLMQEEGSTIEVEDGASFTVQQESTLSGTLSVMGPGASFAAIGPAVQLVGAPRLLAANGGEIQLFADRYNVTDDPGSSTLIAAEGPNSLVDLPMIEAISVGVATDSIFTVAATDGGVVDLTGLDTISGVTDGTGRLLLRADSGGRLQLGGATVSAQTRLEASGADAAIAVDGGMILEPASGIRLTDGGRVLLSAPLYNRGTISGNGTFQGVVFNDGIISPGTSIGELEFEGDLIATPSSLFSFEILDDMMASPRNDRVTATEQIMLAGHLVVMLIEGGMGVFTPIQGDEFELFRAGSGVSGTFSQVTLPPLSEDFGWQLVYEPMAVSMKIVDRLPGDFDADGDVDRDDLVIWQAGVGTLVDASQTNGDSDGDQDVDGHDFLAFLLHFGSNSSEALASSRAAVPEPSAAGLAVLMAAIAWSTIRRGGAAPVPTARTGERSTRTGR